MWISPVWDLEKEMATHSSVLAWRIPGTGELGGLPSMGSHRVGHDWSDLAAASFLKYKFLSFARFGKFSSIVSSTFFFPAWHSFFLPFWDSSNKNIKHFDTVPKTLFFYFFFSVVHIRQFLFICLQIDSPLSFLFFCWTHPVNFKIWLYFFTSEIYFFNLFCLFLLFHFKTV